MPKKYQIFIDRVVRFSEQGDIEPPQNIPAEELDEMEEFLTRFVSAATSVAANDSLSLDERIEEYERICTELIPWRGQLFRDLESYISILKEERRNGFTHVDRENSFFEDLLHLRKIKIGQE